MAAISLQKITHPIVCCICAFVYSVHIIVKSYLNVTEEDTLKYYVYLPTHIFSHSVRALRVALERNVWSELPSVGRENVISKYCIPRGGHLKCRTPLKGQKTLAFPGFDRKHA